MSLWEDLLGIGLEPKEARLYVAVLERGRPTVAEAAKYGGVSRTNAYDIAKRLAQRGLIAMVETAGGRQVLVANDPQRLLDEWQERRRRLDAVVPALQAIQDKAGTRPRVRYFEGSDGIRSALFETLHWPSPLNGILSMADLMAVPGAAAMQDYIEGRRRNELWLRVVRSPEKDTDLGWPSDPDRFREARHAPPAYVFTMTMIIGGDAVALMSSRRENYALVIDSPEFAELQRNLFEVLWAASIPFHTTDTAAPRSSLGADGER